LSSPAHYASVFATLAKNSLIRELTFRGNFIIECISSLSWVIMNFGFYWLVFQYTPMIGADSGWGKYQFFIFVATTHFINSLVEMFFMPNTEEFSELVRGGGLDFALTKPLDTQFLVSVSKIDWSGVTTFLFALVLLVASLAKLDTVPSWWQFALYPLYIISGVGIMYSLMISLSASSIWLGRNQSLYDFWFYITNFSRYPKEIFTGIVGDPLRIVCTFIIPVLVVVNVPARLLALPDDSSQLWLAGYALLATGVSLIVSRWIFQRALLSYRSASS
jgi:ABC-2 type transport system permease protein